MVKTKEHYKIIDGLKVLVVGGAPFIYNGFIARNLLRSNIYYWRKEGTLQGVFRHISYQGKLYTLRVE